MSQSLVQIYLHIVFATKGRSTFLKDTLFRKDVHSYLAGICNNQDCPAITVGGVEDHVHLLCRLGKQNEVSELIRELKRSSSKFVTKQRARLAGFQWQAGYGAFSISPAHVKSLTEYIIGQEEHHRRESFQDELRRLCAKYALKLDERYAWE